MKFTILGFCHKVDEKYTLLGYYPVYSANSLLSFQENQLVLPSKVKKWVGPIGCPQKSVRNYHCTPCNIAEECLFHTQ